MEVAYSQGEVEVEALAYRVGVAVFDACGIGGLALVALSSELEIVGEEIAVDAEVVALQGRLFKIRIKIWYKNGVI